MTVAFLSVSAEMGGSEVSLLELVTGLRRIVPEWRLHVVVPRDGALARGAIRAGARVHVLPLPQRLLRVGEPVAGAGTVLGRSASLLLAAGSAAPYARRLRGLLAEIAPDIVHTNGFKLHVLGSRVAPVTSALVWHLHEYVGRRPISRRLLRRHVARCAGLVANSQSVADDVRAALDPAVPVTTIYNAVDPCEFSPEGAVADLDRLSGLAPAADGTVRIGLVATYGRWKGHATFIEAMRQQNAMTPCRGYIIGDALYDTGGSQYSRAELEAQIAAAGLTGRMGLTGFIDRAATALRALDIVVHASTQPEPFGLVIAEGMAAARAVIVSAAGGAAELIAPEVDALAHEPGDARGLARCIERLVDDARLRARLGDAARRSALRRFNPDTFARAFVELYESTHVSH